MLHDCFSGGNSRKFVQPLPNPVTRTPINGTGHRILVVDDEPEPRRAIARVLRHAGYAVSTADDAHIALHGLSRGHFDTIVSDISMPGLNGISLLRAVRNIDPEVPVILLTGVPAIETAVQALDHGAYKYMVKPLDPAQLLEVTARAVRLAGRRRAADGEAPSSARLYPTDGHATMERALEHLRLVFQPIVHRDGSLFGYEALMRCNMPEAVSPDSLIAMATSLNRLQELGRHARGLASASFSGVQPVGTLFVNIHPSELHDDELLNPRGALRRHAHQVVLEITERASVNSISELPARVEQLRSAGYRIAIDDLGAGYSGLTSFVLLKPDIVKLDMTLVRDVHRQEVKQRLVHSVTTLCADLNIAVVAEGVETLEERAVLMDLGCDLFQGFLIARPGLPNRPYFW